MRSPSVRDEVQVQLVVRPWTKVRRPYRCHTGRCVRGSSWLDGSPSSRWYVGVVGLARYLRQRGIVRPNTPFVPSWLMFGKAMSSICSSISPNDLALTESQGDRSNILASVLGLPSIGATVAPVYGCVGERDAEDLRPEAVSRNRPRNRPVGSCERYARASRLPSLSVDISPIK